MHGDARKKFSDGIAEGLPVEAVSQVRGLIWTGVGLVVSTNQSTSFLNIGHCIAPEDQP